jgi:ribosomal protein S18 acetylase RimI-like enzyme
MVAVTLRPVREDDEQFLFEVYSSTRAEELAITPWTPDQKAQFLRMQFDAQTKYYRQVFPEMDYRIILHDGAPAGRFIVLRQADELRLLDISLLPEHRNAGIGRMLIQKLLDEGNGAGKPVRIHVEHFNRARSLYERLGFRPVSDKGVYIMMEWNPKTRTDLVHEKHSDARI